MTATRPLKFTSMTASERVIDVILRVTAAVAAIDNQQATLSPGPRLGLMQALGSCRFIGSADVTRRHQPIMAYTQTAVGATGAVAGAERQQARNRLLQHVPVALPMAADAASRT